MHRSLKPHPQAKKVAPPAIPSDHYQTTSLFTKPEDSGMVSSPSIEEGGFNLPRESSAAIRIKDELNEYGMANLSKNPNTLAGTGTYANVPVFCATMREPLTHKAAVYYHQQLALQEDQGIDLTQSPGRDSPGSSSGSAGSGSRHSTASLDSGRASSYLTGGGASIRGGGGPLSSPRCSSVSSCSIGSVDRQRNDELIADWLLEMKYEEYAQLFIAAGYDLPTIARMTPEDLTAIGIKNPHHRERIKQRIDKLQVLDNLPHFVPGSIEEWLQLLRLEEYIQPLLDQNYKTVRDVTQLTWEDLEDIGIVKLGHQKKILLAIKRVKDIISGKWNPGGSIYQQQEYRKVWQAPSQLPSPTIIPTARVSWDDSKSYGISDPYFTCTGSNHECNDVVLIKVRQPRGKSLESLEDIHDNSTRSHLTFSHYTTTDYGHFTQPQGTRVLSNPPGNMSWRRSYDDGDITPTNEAARELMYEEGGGTLPRQRGNAADRCKVLQRAVLQNMPVDAQHHYMNTPVEYAVCPDNSSLNSPYLTGSPMANKKIAPEPPRRHCSIRNPRTLSSQEQQAAAVAAAAAAAAAAQNHPYATYATGAPTSYIPSNMQQQPPQPIYANYATIQQTTAEIHCEKLHDNKSTSSIDSIDTIPFANENTGTIKQRLLNRQDLPPQQHLSSSSSSSSSSTNTIANIAHSFHSLKSSSSLHDATLIRSDSTGSNAGGTLLYDGASIDPALGAGGGSGASSVVHLRSPTLTYPPVGSSVSVGAIPDCSEMSSSSVGSGGAAVSYATDLAAAEAGTGVGGGGGGGVPQAKTVSVNVLNDIGNMLANLTDELDAMLEEEKRVGLNIDSE
ncbi:uncharacterized protein LOC129920221 [Episyrphus balteatus]|uniref:uncharacterized protein LOC129920221 n=1 Tax=Episyrphus balteatus TaxID=286459 RepID=UPI002485586C|nr:uncharacterized protein LOC129920221 [Episyrphus balteatus]XP_055857449.1 uncharacterized protein LOC129920221 [Episyrphus balteatus]XP_055857450.1 uncharacterized protein LOC129920221 [Episyrphus balteatus]